MRSGSNQLNPQHKRSVETRGTLAALAAYAMWGLFPLYWKQLKHVESMQILAHRILWAAVVCLILMLAWKRFSEIGKLFKQKKKFFLVFLASIVVTSNWGLYIWAVNVGKVVESALGYYINPLVSVLLGAIFFKEKVDAWTRLAVALAAAGIVGAAILYGSVPWVSLLLAFTFAIYGALKKRVGIEPLISLAVETFIAAPFALAFLVFRQAAGAGAFWNAGALTTILLIFAGLVTALPLFFFAQAANSISLQKMGFIQYVSPCGQLFIGIVVYGEKPTTALLLAFTGVITAVLIYVFTRKRGVRSPR
ncbi:MAG: EamA family transporter RarD [Spirochaetia bacterium]|jgi:chloramphenicol-sensitive protein RarD|nr:EamA family transporter RarD [Spirochaetia bacterium]